MHKPHLGSIFLLLLTLRELTKWLIDVRLDGVVVRALDRFYFPIEIAESALNCRWSLSKVVLVYTIDSIGALLLRILCRGKHRVLNRARGMSFGSVILHRLSVGGRGRKLILRLHEGIGTDRLEVFYLAFLRSILLLWYSSWWGSSQCGLHQGTSTVVIVLVLLYYQGLWHAEPTWDGGRVIQPTFTWGIWVVAALQYRVSFPLRCLNNVIGQLWLRCCERFLMIGYKESIN